MRVSAPSAAAARACNAPRVARRGHAAVRPRRTARAQRACDAGGGRGRSRSAPSSSPPRRTWVISPATRSRQPVNTAIKERPYPSTCSRLSCSRTSAPRRSRTRCLRNNLQMDEGDTDRLINGDSTVLRAPPTSFAAAAFSVRAPAISSRPSFRSSSTSPADSTIARAQLDPLRHRLARRHRNTTPRQTPFSETRSRPSCSPAAGICSRHDRRQSGDRARPARVRFNAMYNDQKNWRDYLSR